jgi:hypothetical protein
VEQDMPMTKRVLVARLHSDGDMPISAPADVTVLCGPQGRQAADLLSGVRPVLEWSCPWIMADPPQVHMAGMARLVGRPAGQQFDVALVLTSCRTEVST